MVGTGHPDFAENPAWHAQSAEEAMARFGVVARTGLTGESDLAFFERDSLPG